MSIEILKAASAPPHPEALVLVYNIDGELHTEQHMFGREHKTENLVWVGRNRELDAILRAGFRLGKRP